MKCAMLVGVALLSMACSADPNSSNAESRQRSSISPKSVIVKPTGQTTYKQAVGIRQMLAMRCQQDEPQDCAKLAEMYKAGVGGQPDLSRARQFDRKACSLGFKPSCQ
jgi:TPR repeat protein